MKIDITQVEAHEVIGLIANRPDLDRLHRTLLEGLEEMRRNAERDADWEERERKWRENDEQRYAADLARIQGLPQFLYDREWFRYAREPGDGVVHWRFWRADAEPWQYTEAWVMDEEANKLRGYFTQHYRRGGRPADRRFDPWGSQGRSWKRVLGAAITHHRRAHPPGEVT